MSSACSAIGFRKVVGANRNSAVIRTTLCYSTVLIKETPLYKDEWRQQKEENAHVRMTS